MNSNWSSGNLEELDNSKNNISLKIKEQITLFGLSWDFMLLTVSNFERKLIFI
jgi:hypothetical protein